MFFLFVCFLKRTTQNLWGFFSPLITNSFKVKQSNLVHGWLLETLLFPKCHFKSVKLSVAILVVKQNKNKKKEL